MRISRRSLAQLSLIAATVAPAGHALAQGGGSLIDRAKKSMNDAASAAKKGLSDEATRQINSAVDAAASAEVADGAFNAAVSPWTSSDGAKRVELARFSGSAFVVTNGANRQIVLCDDRGVLPWLASVTIADDKASVANAGRGSGAPAPGASPAGGRAGRGKAQGGGAATSATTSNGEVVQSGKKGEALPTLVAREYRLPSALVGLTLPTANGADVGAPNVGSLKIGNVSESIFSGAIKVRFAQATIPGGKSKETVDMGVVFKARVLADGKSPGECLSSSSPKGVGSANSGDPKSGGSKDGSSKDGSSKGGSSSDGNSKGGSANGSANGTANGGTNSNDAKGSPAAGSFAEGDVLLPKIANVKLVAESKDDAKLVATLKKGDELVYLGQEQNGYLHVQGSTGEGWVRKALLSKR